MVGRNDGFCDFSSTKYTHAHTRWLLWCLIKIKRKRQSKTTTTTITTIIFANAFSIKEQWKFGHVHLVNVLSVILENSRQSQTFISSNHYNHNHIVGPFQSCDSPPFLRHICRLCRESRSTFADCTPIDPLCNTLVLRHVLTLSKVLYRVFLFCFGWNTYFVCACKVQPQLYDRVECHLFIQFYHWRRHRIRIFSFFFTWSLLFFSLFLLLLMSLHCCDLFAFDTMKLFARHALPKKSITKQKENKSTARKHGKMSGTKLTSKIIMCHVRDTTWFFACWSV